MNSMLQRLYIKNYALIDELDVTFDKGLNVITGETGAGKSIIMDALGLILGARADSDSLRNKSQKCIVEAEFVTNATDVEEFLQQKGFDVDESCIIRREIASNGKSRSFINDTPCTVQLIKELTSHLVDIHSQHQTLDIANSLNQFDVLDSFAGTFGLSIEFRKAFKELQKLKNDHADLVQQQQQELKEFEYNKYLFEELNKAELKIGELESLESEIQTLTNADQIKQQLNLASGLLDSPQGVNTVLKEVIFLLAKAKLSTEEFSSLRSRLDSAFLELKDIASELEGIMEEVVNDPQQLQIAEERLDIINNLLSKHQAKSIEELLLKHTELSGKLNFADSLAGKIEESEKAIRSATLALEEKASHLFEVRSKQTAPLEKKVGTVLHELNMPHAKLEVKLSKLTELNANAGCEIEFMFTANKGGDMKPINKVASGGEFSRLMLAIKSIVSDKKKLQTIIFDEIDTGVSGEVAGKMGDIMRKISGQIQVFAITHLPQVAVKGKHHYKVLKSIQGQSTISKLVKLDENNRVEEIAKMLSGEKLTPEALANAKVLLQ